MTIMNRNIIAGILMLWQLWCEGLSAWEVIGDDYDDDSNDDFVYYH